MDTPASVARVAQAYANLAQVLAQEELSNDAEVYAIERAQILPSVGEDAQVVLSWFHSAVAHAGMVR